MKNKPLAAASLVRRLVMTGLVSAALVMSGLAVAQEPGEAAPAVKAVEVTPVTQEPIDTPPAAPPQKEPAFQGLVPASQNTARPNGIKDNGTKDIVTYGLQDPQGEDTHPILRITPDKSELVRLDRDAASIVVGNPDHLGVLMDNRRLLILVPRQPGATYMTVLDSAGQVIMQRHVIIASPKADYIRIRRSCAGQGRDCQETSVYYCPGMCHPVNTVTTEGGGDLAPLPGRASSFAGGSAPETPPSQEPTEQ